MDNILTQNDGNNQLGIGSAQINILGITGNTLDIIQGTTSFMSISNSSSSEKISVKKPITLANNLLTIKSTAKIDSAATNSLFYIDDNSELKTLGIGTTDEYLRMGFNRPAWGPKTFVETNITENSIGNIGYLEELKIDDDKLIGIGTTLGVKDSSISNIIKYDTNRDISLIMSNGVGIGTLSIQTKYDTNFFDITLKKVDDDFSSNPSSKLLEFVDTKTYKYTINDLSDNSIHYYKLSISDINSSVTPAPTKKFHHITLRRDNIAATALITSHISTYTNNDIPSFTFTTNETGTLTTNISQGFSSSSTISSTGSHTITFNTLPEAEYSGKTITLTDAAGISTTMTLNTFIVDTYPPGNISFTISYYKRVGGVSIGIQESDSVSNEVWLAPANTTSFSASNTMTQSASGLSTIINTPANTGSYYLHIKDTAGNINEISQALQVVLPTQNSGSYPGYMKNLYLDNNPSSKSILSSNEAGSNINIQRSSNKTYYSNVPRNSVGSIGFSMSSSHQFYLTLSQDVSPEDFTISIQEYSNGGFGSTTGSGSAATNSSISSSISNEKKITSSTSLTNNDTNYYKIMINSIGNLSASTYIEHYVALCRGERPHFMHYLNPFFNTSRPIYIKLYGWKLPSTESQISPTSKSEYNYLGANAYYNSSTGGWLQAMYSVATHYGMKMTGTLMYNSYRTLADGNCGHTHSKRWFGKNNTNDTITDSTYELEPLEDTIGIQQMNLPLLIIIILSHIVIIVGVLGESHTNKQTQQTHKEELLGMIGELKMEQMLVSINIIYGIKELMIIHSRVLHVLGGQLLTLMNLGVKIMLVELKIAVILGI